MGARTSEDMGLILLELVDLHHRIWEEFIGKKVLPHVGKMHALSAAVRTASPLDVNLKLFDVMGRIALHGLWLIWANDRTGKLPGSPERRGRDHRIDTLADQLCSLVSNNPALLTPVADEQVIDLALGFMFLAAQGRRLEHLATWISEIVRRADFSYRSRGRFPCTLRGYAQLAEHPHADQDRYLEEVTEASVLLPTLAFWAAALGDIKALGLLARLKKEVLGHCAVQLWLPDEASEPGLWRGQDGHGAAFFDIPLVQEGQPILDYVIRECGPTTPFAELSAVKQGFWPLVLVACRHHRLPVPPHFFVPLTQGLEKPQAIEFKSERRPLRRDFLLISTSHRGAVV